MQLSPPAPKKLISLNNYPQFLSIFPAKEGRLKIRGDRVPAFFVKRANS
jgi:hypothetical protein